MGNLASEGYTPQSGLFNGIESVRRIRKMMLVLIN
jgi:uncharacterized protein YegP (UPF0339 family)